MAYVAAVCLPYHGNGYAYRTWEVLRALRAGGGRVWLVPRPGYPWDRRDRLVEPLARAAVRRDGVPIVHLRSPSRRKPMALYALLGAWVLRRIFRRVDIGVVHAASNHENALPALLAARSLGLPFFYEIRGIWEWTRDSRHPGYADSAAGRRALRLERLIARNSDRVFVISEPLRRHVVEEWGVAPERCELLPNCVAEEAVAQAPVPGEPGRIGYAGSLVAYEGLDDVLHALAVLREKGVVVRLDVVGEGEQRSALEALAERLALTDRVRFHGRLPRAEAAAVLSRCAAIALARKPERVCRYVPPLKLVEALAQGKPVIVPDLEVFRSELGDSAAAWWFEAGNVASLAAVLERKLFDADTIGRSGRAALDHVRAHRTWPEHVARVLAAYARAGDGPPTK